MDFGEKVRKLRLEKDVSLQDIYVTTGISKGTMSRYETGQRNPTLDTLLRLSKYFHVSIDYLAGLSDIQSPKYSLTELASMYNQLTDDQKVKAILFINKLLEEQK
jgi:transcriptional regulator with XRE-family HTH domain